jgi:hypothetical protein
MSTSHRSTRFQAPGTFEVVNVLDMGADPTGTQDATVAFRNAVALAASVSVGGGTVYVPPGTYKITDTITVPTAIRIVGSGADATILTFAPTTSVFLFQAGGSTAGWYCGWENFSVNVTTSNAAGVWDIQDQARFFSFARLNVTGYAAGTGTGVQFSGQVSANSFHCFQQCRFRQFASCMKLSGFANGNLILDCHFSACTDGLDFRAVGSDTTSGQDNLIARCEFNGSTTNAIHLSSTSVRNCFVKCVCDGPTNSVTGASSTINCTFVSCWLNPNPDTNTVAGNGATLIGCSYESSGATSDPLSVYRAAYVRQGGGGTRLLELLCQSSAPQARVRIGGGADGDEMRMLLPAGTSSKFSVHTGSPAAESLSVVNHEVTAGAGNVVVNTAGKGLKVKEGSNAKMGRAVLSGGAVVVATTAVTASSEIFVTSQIDGGTPGWLRVSARNAAQDFTITSSSGTDTSTVAWFIVEPA